MKEETVKQRRPRFRLLRSGDPLTLFHSMTAAHILEQSGPPKTILSSTASPPPSHHLGNATVAVAPLFRDDLFHSEAIERCSTARTGARFLGNAGWNHRFRPKVAEWVSFGRKPPMPPLRRLQRVLVVKKVALRSLPCMRVTRRAERPALLCRFAWWRLRTLLCGFLYGNKANLDSLTNSCCNAVQHG